MLILALPVAIIYGYAYPWAKAEKILNEYDYSSKITVGASSSYHHANGETQETKQRTYILVPRGPELLKMVTVIENNYKMHKEEWPPFSIYVLAGLYSGLIYVTYKSWEKHLTRRCS